MPGARHPATLRRIREQMAKMSPAVDDGKEDGHATLGIKQASEEGHPRPAVTGSASGTGSTPLPVSLADILARLSQLDVALWEYTPDAAGHAADGAEIAPGVHIGPMAESFADTFGIGDGQTIELVDAVGIALAAIKALETRVADLETERTA